MQRGISLETIFYRATFYFTFLWSFSNAGVEVG